MQTNPTDPINGGVDPEELARHIAEMYRDVANEVEPVSYTHLRAHET